jgi:NADPH-dependent 2,4-dienoyl-CoA reductase/sulfur reductase-like enzyme/nitrite reductase/ring-hydroxylating ferredoxin subunit
MTADTTMPAMQKVALLSDLPDAGMKRVELHTTLEGNAESVPILLIRSGDTVRAFGARCPHAGAPLEEGALCNGRLVCPWHKATFDVESGSIVEPPALAPLTRYAVRVESDDVLVSTTPEVPAASATTTSDQRTFAVVGAGAAGAAACAALREFGYTGRLVLIDHETRTPYDRTVLSKFVASGEMKPDEVPPLLPDDFFAKQRNERIQGEVKTLDARQRRIDIEGAASIQYDAALIATGGLPKAPSLKGGDHLAVKDRILVLRNRDDAHKLVEAAQKCRHVVVLGASFIGLEIASALRKRKLQVTVVSPGKVPFETQFGAELGRLFMRLHEGNGTGFRMGTQVDAVEPNEADPAAGAMRAVLANGEALTCDFIVVGTGVTPATGFIEGITRNDDESVDVDATMRVCDGLYAAGDIARFELQPSGSRTRIEHWRVAQQHARIAARAMAGLPAGDTLVPFFWTYHFGKRFEYLGHGSEWDDAVFTGTPGSFEFIALLCKDGHLAAAVGCNREKQMGMLAEAMRRPLATGDAKHIAEAD